MEKLVRDKIMSYMEHAQMQEKALTTLVFFLVLSLFYRSQMVNFKEIYHFLRFQRGFNFFQGGGSNFFFRGGGVQTPCPPSGSALLEENRLFTKHQHGFRKRYSCVTQLIDVCEKWTEELDNKNSIDVVY